MAVATKPKKRKSRKVKAKTRKTVKVKSKSKAQSNSNGTGKAAGVIEAGTENETKDYGELLAEVESHLKDKAFITRCDQARLDTQGPTCPDA